MQSKYSGYIPTVSEILKLVEKIAYRFDAHTFLSDVFECSAIAVSNRFDHTKYKTREERYLQIIKKQERELADKAKRSKRAVEKAFT